MPPTLKRQPTPEERELEAKRTRLKHLESQLADRELELSTARAELVTFERRYLRVIGVLYARLDQVNAAIAETLARRKPRNQAAQQRAATARKYAATTATATELVITPAAKETFQPSPSLRQLFREVAKQIHPDLANGTDDRAVRERLMAEANRAYEDGDEARLEAILREYQCSPEAVKGEGVGADLVRLVRTIALVEDRLATIEAELAGLYATDLTHLRKVTESAQREGRDLLLEMVAEIEGQIKMATKQLEKIKQQEVAT